MTFFIVHRDHNVILGTADVMYTTFNSYFHEVTEQQIEQYERLQSSLAEDHYVELSDIIRPAKQLSPQLEEHKSATPEFRKAVADMFKSKPRKGNNNDCTIQVRN